MGAGTLPIREQGQWSHGKNPVRTPSWACAAQGSDASHQHSPEANQASWQWVPGRVQIWDALCFLTSPLPSWAVCSLTSRMAPAWVPQAGLAARLGLHAASRPLLHVETP